MVGFSLCISSRNLIIANFSRCVRSLLSETHLTFYFYLNVIAASLACYDVLLANTLLLAGTLGHI
jgi:hypothetical protein